MESIRDSLSEELVKMTEQCEKLRAEASMLPSVKAELDALRRRHSAALELMGERDEEGVCHMRAMPTMRDENMKSGLYNYNHALMVKIGYNNW
ncbi:Golgin candidate [Arachis hypogaea]|uniref:Golgin candidate n=1 Tax=Arachis hypogaea TaxID=3818 RepID=A0A6B9V4N8_ARAHY|nr:Golgin candidate [Arachis hypogaea]